MRTDIEILLNHLERLRDDLQRSKNGADKYISTLIADLSKAPSPKSLVPLLQQIKSGFKIVEYADFNARQEDIWLEIWNEVTRILEEQTK